MKNKQDKWDEAYQDADIASAKVTQALADNSYLLPQNGTALDLACGRAGNAVFLAKKGFEVDAIDVSPVVLSHLKKYVVSQDLSVDCIQRDIENEGLSDKQYDVIVVGYFLNRDLFPQIIKALKPNGLLFYQTWSQLKIDDKGPSNPDFRLKAGELLSLTTPLRTVLYQENGDCGDTARGLRNEALIIAQKL